MEKIICNRLTNFVENNNRLSFTQGGFRKICTMDKISIVENVIRTTMFKNWITYESFFDEIRIDDTNLFRLGTAKKKFPDPACILVASQFFQSCLECHFQQDKAV